jgi:hypothetical protein
VTPAVHITRGRSWDWVVLLDSVPAFATYYDVKKLWPAASPGRVEALTAPKRSVG